MHILCVKKYNLLPFASLGGYKRETLQDSFSVVAWGVQYVTYPTISSLNVGACFPRDTRVCATLFEGDVRWSCGLIAEKETYHKCCPIFYFTDMLGEQKHIHGDLI